MVTLKDRPSITARCRNVRRGFPRCGVLLLSKLGDLSNQTNDLRPLFDRASPSKGLAQMKEIFNLFNSKLDKVVRKPKRSAFDGQLSKLEDISTRFCINGVS